MRRYKRPLRRFTAARVLGRNRPSRPGCDEPRLSAMPRPVAPRPALPLLSSFCPPRQSNVGWRRIRHRRRHRSLRCLPQIEPTLRNRRRVALCRCVPPRWQRCSKPVLPNPMSLRKRRVMGMQRFPPTASRASARIRGDSKFGLHCKLRSLPRKRLQQKALPTRGPTSRINNPLQFPTRQCPPPGRRLSPRRRRALRLFRSLRQNWRRQPSPLAKPAAAWQLRRSWRWRALAILRKKRLSQHNLP